MLPRSIPVSVANRTYRALGRRRLFFLKLTTYGAVCNRTIGVNLAIFHGIFVEMSPYMPPLQG